MSLSRPIHSPNLRSLLVSIKPISFPNPHLRSILPRKPNLLLNFSTAKPHHHEAAHQLFDGTPNRAVIHPNERGGSPRVSCIVRAITGAASHDLNRGIHTVVIKLGFELEVPVATALIGFYSSLHDLGSARKLFLTTPMKDMILWSAMVSACCKNVQFVEAINTFSEMQRSGIGLNYVSFIGVLPACANTGNLRYGRQIHGLSIPRGIVVETSFQNSLIDMYSKCGELDEAILVFDAIKDKDGISWKNIIFGCTSSGHPKKAFSLFCDMRNSHLEPDKMTLRNLISSCSQVGDLTIGHQLHSFVVKKGLLGSTSIGTTLFRIYAEAKEVGAARALFDQLRHKDFIAWNGMVSAYSHSRRPVLALEMFREMQQAKEEANEMTYVSLLHACSMMEAREFGRSIHAHIMRLGYMSNLYLASALIDFYCRIGKLKQAEILFDKIQSKDLVCWSSMIKGYGTNGCGREAIHAFCSMLEHRLLPNEIVFISLLSACGHCGMIDEGWKWFNSMQERFGICPTLQHYTCMVDMLGRKELVEEALDFVKRMPMEPDVSIWGALLSWCRTTNDGKVAEVAAKQLIRLDPDNSSYYVTLSNMYSEHEQWGDAERTRELMEKKGLRKIAGYSLVDGHSVI